MSSAPTSAGSAALAAENPAAKRDSGEAGRFIDRQLIPERVQFIVRTLQQRNFQAFVVGGSVRDLLLGQRPKDFDVSTDARPEQVKSIFRRDARLVGRRFLIAHLSYRRRRGRSGGGGDGRDDIIEVTTFRSAQRDSDQNIRDRDGQLLSDNAYGRDVEEDARRRDFSVNALYYDPERQQVHDFVGGLEDLESRRLRVIGDPELRYREDPVRMLRALHFIARLDFKPDAENDAALRRLAPRIQGARPARLALEMRKMFPAPRCTRVWELLEEYGLFAALFPAVAPLLGEEPHYRRLIRETLKNTEQRMRNGAKGNIAFLYTALLWPALERRMKLESGDQPWRFGALREAAGGILSDQAQRVGIPAHMRSRITDCWEMQLHLERRQGKESRARQLLHQPAFRAGLALLELRGRNEEELRQRSAWWRERETPEAAPAAAAPRRRSHSRSRRRRS